MSITDPAHWKEKLADKGDKYDKIVEMIAELNTPTVAPAAHKTSHQDGGTDEISIEGLSGMPAELAAFLAIGSSNALWKPCVFIGDNQDPSSTRYNITTGGGVANAGAADPGYYYMVPLEPVRNGKTLRIAQIKANIVADLTDYILSITFNGKNGGINTVITTWTVTWNSSGEKTYDGTDIDLGATYDSLVCQLNCSTSTINELIIHDFLVQYYYA